MTGRPASLLLLVVGRSHDRLHMLLDVVTHVIDGERPLEPEGPGERSSPFGVREAIEIKVQPSAPTRQPAAGVRNKSSVRHHHAQQLGG